MSAQCLYVMEDEAVFVANDTMGVACDGSGPIRITDKAVEVPHLRMILTGAGYHQFLLEWYYMLMCEVDATDIAVLNESAPSLLSKAWRRFQRKNDLSKVEGNVPGSGGSKIAHLGYSPEERGFVGFYYKLQDDFQPTRMQNKPYYMPKEDGVRSQVFEKGLPLSEEIVEFFKYTKSVDEEHPVGERVGIGGEIWLRAISSDLRFTTERLHIFDDYDETLEQVREAGSPVGR